MKKLSVCMVCLSVALVFSLPHSNQDSLNAQHECCKQRDDEDSPWYENGLNYNECKRLNREEDGDNVRSDDGLVWWDDNC